MFLRQKSSSYFYIFAPMTYPSIVSRNWFTIRLPRSMWLSPNRSMLCVFCTERLSSFHPAKSLKSSETLQSSIQCLKMQLVRLTEPIYQLVFNGDFQEMIKSHGAVERVSWPRMFLRQLIL